MRTRCRVPISSTELTELVEEAVLAEFDRIAERGGVLGAMETGYQRGRIQDESMLYEHRKHDGSLPDRRGQHLPQPQDRRGAHGGAGAGHRRVRSRVSSTRLHAFHEAHRAEAPAALALLREAAMTGGNVFEALMEAVKSCSLGQISEAFFEVGGQYRRNV